MRREVNQFFLSALSGLSVLTSKDSDEIVWYIYIYIYIYDFIQEILEIFNNVIFDILCYSWLDNTLENIIWKLMEGIEIVCSSNNSSASQKDKIPIRRTCCRANQFSELLINTWAKIHHYIT